MVAFEDAWRESKRYRIEEFKPFALVNGQLWAPAYIKNKWRILELDMSVAKNGAGQVFALAGDARNIFSFVHAAASRDDRRTPNKKAGS